MQSPEMVPTAAGPPMVPYHRSEGCSRALCAVGPHTASKLRPLRPYVSLPSPHTAIAVAGRDWPQRTVHRTQP